MKKLFLLLLCILLIFSTFSCEDNEGNTDSFPDQDDSTIDEEYDRTVYVSKSSHKVHSISYCSGMKYYYEMSYYEALLAGYDFCDNCN